MKTYLVLAAVLLTSAQVFAQMPEGEEVPSAEVPGLEQPLVESGDRLNYSLEEIKRLSESFRPAPVTIIDDNGVRIYNSQAEADREEAKIRQEREELRENIERSNHIFEAAAERRANDAQWKLMAIAGGLILGVIRILWGLATGKE